MSYIEPRNREGSPELAPLFELVEKSMGFVPNSMLTMAHWPELLQAFTGLAGTVLGQSRIDPGLRQLIALAVSAAAGCRYCQAHTSHGAERHGVDAERIAAVYEYESSPLFNDAERAALRVAANAGMVPNAVEPAHMQALKQHFDDRECLEIVAVIALFGFLNRWNDTLATTLEDAPAAFAGERLAESGWTPGKHGDRAH